MNAVGIALAWCAIQVTLVGLAASGLYVVFPYIGLAARALVPLTTLVVILALTVLAFSPWPDWSLVAPASWSESPSAQAHFEVLAGSIDPSGHEASPAGVPVAGEAASRPQLPVDEETSPATVVWRGVYDELLQTPTSFGVTRWRWPAAFAVFFLLAVAVGLTRLLAGMLALRSYRKRSQPVRDPELLGLVRGLRAELGCRRRVEVRQSDTVATGAAIGWRRPVILLPVEWTTWTAAQRRAVLAHEIAHVRAGDFLSALCAQLGLVLHFYHPLVHWWTNRLRLEQELTADAAAAGVMGGQRKYLAAIAELALHRPDGLLAWPARSFLPTRTTFLRRIAMLRDAKSRPERASLAARVLAVAAVLLCGLLVAGLRGPSGGPRVFAQAADEPAAVVGDEGTTAGIGTEAISEANERVGLLDVLRLEPSGDRRPAVRGRAAERAGLEAEYQTDFRGAAFDHNTLMPSGFETLYGLQLLKPEPRGLRVVIPFHQGDAKPFVGFFPLFKIHGDFEITAAYEIAAIEPPSIGRAAGVDLYILCENTRNDARLRRGVRPEGDQVYLVHHSVQNEEGKLRRSAEYFPAKSPIGKLRLARTGETLEFLVAEGDSDRFEKLHEVEFGTSTVGLLRVDTTTEGSRTSVENLWKDLAIRAGELEPVDVPLLRNRPPADDPSYPSTSQSSPRTAEPVKLRITRYPARRAGAGEEAQSMNNLKQIGLAMHMYHDKHKRFPPAVLYGPDGKTPYSWRVALLPYLEQEALYKEYRFDEPWDSPHNRKLAETVVPVYRSPKDSPGTANASLFVLTGPGTIFDREEGTRIFEIRDGTSNTMLVVESRRDVPWTKPEDIAYDPQKPVPKLGGYYEGGFHAVLADGSARFIPDSMGEESLRGAIDKADGQVVEWP